MKTTFLSPEEKRIYIEGLKEAAKIADLSILPPRYGPDGFHNYACQQDRDTILTRIKELEKKSETP